MKICRLEDLVENDIIAKPVMTDDYQVLLSEGTILKKEYIVKLKEFYIHEVYIKEEEIDSVEIFTEKKAIILKESTECLIKEKVKDILERHTFQKNKELIELCQTADNIISGILQENQVVEKIFDIKQRNADIYEHSVNICILASVIAIKMGLSKKSIHDIGVGCLLHDLGLRYISIDYINKEVKELNDLERIEYKKHPVYGYSAIENEEWLSEISKQIILYHHEHIDGTGFPIKMKKIPLECQIVSVCDTFDEMICGIGYSRLKIYEAVEYLKTYAVSFYDKKIITIFLNFTAVYPVGSQVLTSDGNTAFVIKQNDNFPDRPILKVVRDSTGNTVFDEIIIDLLDKHHIFIDKVLN